MANELELPGRIIMKPGLFDKLFFSLLLLLVPVQAQRTASSVRPAALQKVGIDQKLGAELPLELAFRNEDGNSVHLQEYFDRRPVVLALVYYECPMLCTQVLNGLTAALRILEFRAGQEFEVVIVSIDSRETPALAAAKKKEYLHRYGRPDTGVGWHFLTGDEDSIQELARAVGFRYTYDPKTDLYIHASTIMILTPEGRLARYFYGIEYSPRDLRLGLVEASAERIGSPIDQVLLFCYQYDPMTGKYGVVIMRILQLAGLATFVSLGVFIFVMLRRERVKKGSAPNVG